MGPAVPDRRFLAPLLFEAQTGEAARRAWLSPGNRAPGLPTHSLTTLWADRTALTLNEVTPPGRRNSPLIPNSRPAPLQERASIPPEDNSVRIVVGYTTGCTLASCSGHLQTAWI